MLNAQGGVCALCGKPVSLSYHYGSESATLEDVTPRKVIPKGTRRHGNHLVTHAKCNSDKADRPPRPCEILLIWVVNRRLGVPEGITAQWDTVKGKCPNPRLPRTAVHDNALEHGGKDDHATRPQ